VKFTNVTPFTADWTVGFERDGRELLIVIVKATYELPRSGDPAKRATEQLALIQADEFEGAPGVSAPTFETDYAHRKLACDVLLIGCAHAPPGREARHVEVALTVGPMTKRFAVVGDRTWSTGPLGLRASEAQPFSMMPVGYGRAFGGVDRTREANTGEADTFLLNPAGRGYSRHPSTIDGKPLPNTEELGRAVTQPSGNYRPMALSPIGRAWEPRWRFAGTYDDAWIEGRAPFWPDDFDYRYFQAAPADQTIPYPKGGVRVQLHNLSADGARDFALPEQAMSATFIPHRGKDVTREAVLDTIVIEPEAERFTLTWRCGLALGKSVFDVRETIAGALSPAWHRARRFPGKAYYRSLADAVAARAKGRKR
jgi:hypothetical protein